MVFWILKKRSMSQQCFQQMLLYPTLTSNKMHHVPGDFRMKQQVVLGHCAASPTHQTLHQGPWFTYNKWCLLGSYSHWLTLRPYLYRTSELRSRMAPFISIPCTELVLSIFWINRLRKSPWDTQGSHSLNLFHNICFMCWEHMST